MGEETIKGNKCVKAVDIIRRGTGAQPHFIALGGVLNTNPFNDTKFNDKTCLLECLLIWDISQVVRFKAILSRLVNNGDIVH